MADHSSIEWTEATWNPITGCSLASAGCRHCYAARLAATRLKHHPSRKGLARLNAAGEAKFTGELRFNEEWLTQPLRWRRPRMIFVVAHGDLFHENVPDEWIDRIFAVMALAPQHTFQVLTKRSKRMRAYVSDWELKELLRIRLTEAGKSRDDLVWPLPNVWLGVSCEDQATATARIPDLLATPAAIRFVSAEPLLGKIDFSKIAQPNMGFGPFWLNALQAGEMGWYSDEAATKPTEADPLAFSGDPAIDWIIVGGESGENARPMHPDWARSIRDQCKAAATAFFFKQWGSWAPARVQPSGTPGRYAIATAGPQSSFWPAHVTQTDFYPRQIDLFGGARVLEYSKKKTAGRLLDGVEHSEMPEDLR
ncbi:MAG: phage Gp37/Gp68 family protein [Mesorhizobium sp.]|nr:phage Gp37/Gp68 family protein [Mesorhizobium sp.]